MLTVEVNEQTFLVKQGTSVIEACKHAGVLVPRFCYHELLSVSGNCRMCLVAIETPEFSKLLLACVTESLNDMKINTRSENVLKTREDILELLLINHPLDCPICDQAGECDLQDQSKNYGSNKSKFLFNRRAVEDKNCGLLIKTIMTRCIHCTRCVRFFNELEGVPILGTFGRGESTEIGSYVYKSASSEISGNVIDLCPVGALTASYYAFKARPWELSYYESIDVSDGFGSRIYVQSRNGDIYRILPKQDDYAISSIISDKTRFSFDFNTHNRLNSVFLNKGGSGLVKKTWTGFIKSIIKSFYKKLKLLFYVDETLDLLNAKNLLLVECSNKPNILIRNISGFKNYINFYFRNLTDRINSLSEVSSTLVFFSLNTKMEAVVINTILKIKDNFYFNISYSLGLYFKNNLNLLFTNLKNEYYITVLESKHFTVSESASLSQQVVILFGSAFSKAISNLYTLVVFLKFKLIKSTILNVTKTSNTSGFCYLNVRNINTKSILNSNIHAAINLDDVYKSRRYYNTAKTKNTLWCNTHYSSLAFRSKFLIPLFTSYEQREIHLNFENKPKKTQPSVLNSSDARSLESLILSLFSGSVIRFIEKYDYKSLNIILEEVQNPFLVNINTSSFLFTSFFNFTETEVGTISTTAAKVETQDFHVSGKTNKNSVVMLKLSRNKRKEALNF